MLNYTKGEWEFNRFDLTIRVKEWQKSQTMGDYRGCIIADLKPAIGADEEKDIELSKQVHAEGWTQTEANAHLIAAAPDMYEALNNLIQTATILWDKVKPIKDTDTLTVTHPMIEQAKQALAKADGKPESLADPRD